MADFRVTAAKMLAVSLFAAITSPAVALPVVQTFGSGSAVATVQASADFESTASLATTYSEGGMTFTRVGISDNNNGCGFAGCTGNFQAFGFVGNYFYGADDTNQFPLSYIQIDSDGGVDRQAIEFMFGWGPNSHAFYWEAYRDGLLVDAGNGNAGPGSVLGLASATGFDMIRFTDSAFTGSISSLADGVSPAIDSVRIGLAAAIPEPGTFALLGFGLFVLLSSRRRIR